MLSFSVFKLLKEDHGADVIANSFTLLVTDLFFLGKLSVMDLVTFILYNLNFHDEIVYWKIWRESRVRV